jgi:hypothetical protein
MNRLTLTALAGVLGVGLLSAAPDPAAAQRSAPPDGANRFKPPDTAASQGEAPDRKVSMPVPFPDFLPGLGTLYVDPTTPAGPFLAYDRQRTLVSSIYMIPLKDLNAQKAFSDLTVARERVDHVDIVFNAGHPGVAEPHYHVILWYVSPQRAAQLVD